MLPPACNDCCHHTNLGRRHVTHGRDGPPGRPLVSARAEMAVDANLTFTRSCLAIIVIILCSVVATHAQEPTPTPTPQTDGQPTATTFEVIVTGSNIPTAEEVGPQPIDIYRRVDIERLGVR